ncbi:MAG: DUF3289 family protein, partial [Coriobacteriia bacterium]|nr:DUF3289 family protein [Coriobacteriia bacterium]
TVTITTNKPGSLTLTAKYKYATVSGKARYISATAKVTIKDIKIVLQKEKTIYTWTQNAQLKASVETLPQAKVTWESSNSSVVSVNKTTGVLVGNKGGKAIITARYRELSSSCTVTVVSTVSNVCVYQTEHREADDGTTTATPKDLRYNDKTKDQITRMKLWGEYGDDEVMLAADLKILCKLASNGSLQTVAQSMVDKFLRGDGGTFNNPTLTQKVRNHTTTQAYIESVQGCLNQAIRENKGDITKLKYDHTVGPTARGKASRLIALMQKDKIKEPVFNRGSLLDSNSDLRTGLTFMVNSLWGNKITVKSYTLNGKSYSGVLTFKLYDHFGLDDEGDLKYIEGPYPGFKSWYILQHYTGFKGRHKPFITVMQFDVPFAGTL